MFNVEKELLDSHEALLTVTFEEEAIQKEMHSAARAVARQFSIPGFRKGKAPYNVVLQYVGKEAIYRDVADKLLENNYPDFLKAAEVVPYGPGDLEEMSFDPFTFKIRVPLQPRVELGEYRDLRLEPEDVEVSEEEFDAALESIRQDNTILEPVDRPAEMGDEVYIDVQGGVEDEELIDEEDVNLLIEEDTEDYVAPGFMEQLIGMSEGDEKTLTLILDDSYGEDLDGTEASFDVKMNTIYSRSLPEMDDALASTVGNYETLDELKEELRSEMQSYKDTLAETDYFNEMFELLLDEAEVSYPPLLVEDEIDDLVEDARKQLKRQGVTISLEDMLQLQGQTLADFREDLRPRAKTQVESSLILNTFIQVENIHVHDDEVVREYSERVKNSQIPAGVEIPELTLDSPMGQRLRNELTLQKAMERLAAIGRGEAEVEPAAESSHEGSEVVVEAATGDDEEHTGEDVDTEA